MRYAHIPNTHSPSQLALGKRTRAGFTLVELLVVIAIIGMLVALLIPAVNGARLRAQQAACLNNMSQIGKAIVTYESSKQRYPGYIEPVKAVGRETQSRDYVMWVPGDGGSEYSNSGYALTEITDQGDAKRASRVSWAAHILPQVDGQDIWDIVVGAEAQGHAAASQQVLKPLEVYLCPSDTDLDSADGAAGLSYVVNTGGWDFDQNTSNLQNAYHGDSKDNGLFHNMVDGNGQGVKSRMSAIRDGASTTLMLAENIQKNPTYSYFGVAPGNPGEQQMGMVWVVPPVSGGQLNLAGTCGNQSSGLAINDQVGMNFEPSGALNFPETAPCFARPSSNHPNGSINVVFADGHGDSINPDIDYIIYQQLLTTHGAKSVDPADQAADPQPEGVLVFRRAPPLSANDY